MTLEKIVEEKRIFDLSLRVEKLGVGEEDRKWCLPGDPIFFCLFLYFLPISDILPLAPSVPSQVSTLSGTANFLHVSIERFEGDTLQGPLQLLFATTADRQLHLLAPDSSFTLVKSISHLQDSPILTCVPFGIGSMRTISCGMSGQTVLYDHKQDRVLDERRDHRKYIVKVATCDEGDATFVATAGWDGKVCLYRIRSGTDLKLGEPVASISLATNPETIVFVKHPDLNRPILLATRRDSTMLLYYSLPGADASSSENPLPMEMELVGSQNLAPHSNAWIAFSPSSVAVCPTDPTLLAVATSAVPHMKLIIVRLLIPLGRPSTAADGRPATQAVQARASLAAQDKEDAAILVHVSTLAPQTPYSTPQVVWRPDGSGVWVNGDDGVLRGLEAKTGRIIAALKEGHELGSKIRSIWCGMVDVGGKQEEWVVSGGFDRRLVVWKPEKET